MGSKQKSQNKQKKIQNSKLPTLDLHGYTTDEVPDAIDRFLSQANKKSIPSIRIMTGKGAGKVKKVATEYLRLGGFPWKYEKSQDGKTNEGVLVVFLD